MARRKTIRQSASITLDLGRSNPKQELFYQSRALYTAYGGAKGGGKTHAVRTKAGGGAIRWPGIRILIIRRTYPELQQNHVEPILKLVRPEIASYNSTLHTMYFINGSIIKFGHYQGATAEQEYQGQEYDWIFIDEATQFTEREFRFLGGCLRGTSNIPKRFYLTCNPGGVGHQWVKRLFIDRQFKTGSLNPEENENPDDYAFIFASVEDNEHLLKTSPAYLQMLSSLPERMKRAYRYGDWNALSGAYFSEFSEERHVTEPFKIPEHWQRYRAFDYGLDMLAAGWFAQDEKGRSYMYRELKTPNLNVADAAGQIISCTLPDERISITFAPPDMWSRQKDTGKTMAELFFLNGVPILKADSSRVQGWLQVRDLLMLRGDGRPNLMFFSSCTETINDLKSIQTSDKNPNDCAERPHDVTHCCDMVRYYCVSRTLKTEVQIARREMPDEEMDDYDDYMTGGTISRSYMEF